MTFPVHEVESATSLVKQTPYQQAVEDYLLPERRKDGLEKQTLEACSLREVGLVSGITHHPLVAALGLAYAGHRPVALSPDMVWLLICQGVAQHINNNSEALRPEFVAHPGRLTLELRREGVEPFRKGFPDNPWPEAFAGFSSQIRQHIGPKHDLFVSTFTTTGPVERAASEIVLLDSMQRYFHYGLSQFICGIPTVTLEGTAEDWETIAQRVDGFMALDLDWWLDPLRPILGQFACAAAGQVDADFWRSMYRICPPHQSCSLESAAGWIALFFPYLTDRDGRPTRRNPRLSGERDPEELLHPEIAGRSSQSESAMQPGFLYQQNVPSGMAKAPFTWQERRPNGDLDRRWNMELLAGFVGVAQDATSLRLRPEIGWAVREALGNGEDSRREDAARLRPTHRDRAVRPDAPP